MSTYQFLLSLTEGINANNGTDNCAHCALRFDQYVAKGINEGLPPVPTSHAGLETFPVFKNGVLAHSSSNDPRLIERSHSSASASDYRLIIDLSNERNSLLVDLTKEKTVHFFSSNPGTILKTLQTLPKRRKDNTAYGLILLTDKTNEKTGHLLNYFVGPDNELFFIDAQRKTPSERITKTLDLKNYRTEIFYLPSFPPEGIKCKQENESTLDHAISSKVLGQTKAPNLMQELSEKDKNGEISAAELVDLGDCYKNGLDTKKNLSNAFKCYQKATKIDPNNAVAWNSLGIYYRTAHGKNFKEAFQCIEKATKLDSNYAPAWINLGLCYQYEIGTNKNLDKAFTCFVKASQLDPNNAESWLHLGICYLKGVGTTKNPDEAFKCFQKASELAPNNTEIWLHLGICYLKGIGTTPNPDEAFKCFQKASELAPNNTEIWLHLGICYFEGIGTIKNPVEAFICFQKASYFDKNNAEAWLNMGRCYRYAIGTAENPKQAFQCFIKASQIKPDFALAWKDLGLCYLDAFGTAKNPKEAFECFKKAIKFDPMYLKAWQCLESYAVNIANDSVLTKICKGSIQMINRGEMPSPLPVTTMSPPVSFSATSPSTTPFAAGVSSLISATSTPARVHFAILPKTTTTSVIFTPSNDSPCTTPVKLTPSTTPILFSSTAAPSTLTTRTAYASSSKVVGQTKEATGTLTLQKRFQELSEKNKNNEISAVELIELGDFYKNNGKDTEKDFPEAFKCYEKATKMDLYHADAWIKLGRCYEYGIGTIRKPDKIFFCYAMAAAANPNDATAWLNLGYCYEKAIGTDKNPEKAFECFQTSTKADVNYAVAWVKLKICYQNGFGTEPNPELARLCEENVQNYLRNVFPSPPPLLETIPSAPLLAASSSAAPKARVPSLISMTSSPEQKRFQALCEKEEKNELSVGELIELGNCYKGGRGTNKNSPEAFKRYENAFKHFYKAIEINPKDAAAWFQLGRYYRYAIGTVENLKEAFNCFKKASELQPNYAIAWKDLGICYLDAIGTPKNLDEAFNCFQKALESDPMYTKAWDCLERYAVQTNKPELIEICRLNIQKINRGEKPSALPSTTTTSVTSTSASNDSPRTTPAALTPSTTAILSSSAATSSILTPSTPPVLFSSSAAPLLKDKQDDIQQLKREVEILKKMLALRDQEIILLKEQLGLPSLNEAPRREKLGY